MKTAILDLALHGRKLESVSRTNDVICVLDNTRYSLTSNDGNTSIQTSKIKKDDVLLGKRMIVRAQKFFKSKNDSNVVRLLMYGTPQKKTL